MVKLTITNTALSTCDEFDADERSAFTQTLAVTIGDVDPMAIKVSCTDAVASRRLALADGGRRALADGVDLEAQIRSVAPEKVSAVTTTLRPFFPVRALRLFGSLPLRPFFDFSVDGW